jgi:hypothetical protein
MREEFDLTTAGHDMRVGHDEGLAEREAGP